MPIVKDGFEFTPDGRVDEEFVWTSIPGFWESVKGFSDLVDKVFAD